MSVLQKVLGYIEYFNNNPNRHFDNPIVLSPEDYRELEYELEDVTRIISDKSGIAYYSENCYRYLDIAGHHIIPRPNLTNFSLLSDEEDDIINDNYIERFEDEEGLDN